MIPIFDAHLDLAWNALSWNRDLTEPLERLRQREAHMTDRPSRGRAAVALPEMRRGSVLACVATLLVRAKPDARPADGHRRTDLDYANQTIACAVAHGQLEYYRLLQEYAQVKILTSAAALDAFCTSVQSTSPDARPIGIILSMEGADPIVSPAKAARWFDDGLRVVGLAHYGKSAYAAGTGDEGPLTPAGIDLLGEMHRLGMIFDLAHCSDTSFRQAIDRFDGPILASHNNCRALVPGDRQFSDEQIRMIIERGGVIGAAMDNWMLRAGYERGKTERRLVTLDHVADHIDHICQLAGTTRHAAIGSDLDGGFGTEQCPTGLESIADLQKLQGILAARGYSRSNVEDIFHGNWMRFFRQGLPD